MSSGFVTESELEEKRKLRQEEWEKVRNADQPLEAPEEPYDHRSLFDRLEEQKQKKLMEYEEAHKLKNMIKGLDDDEVDFLDLVDQKKIEAEQMKDLEEKQELLEFRKHVEKLREESIDERIKAEIRPVVKPSTHNYSTSVGAKSQRQQLQGVVVKRKAPDSSSTQNGNSSPSPTKRTKEESPNPAKPETEKRKRDDDSLETTPESVPSNVTWVLPGLGDYTTSSDSDSSDTLDEPEHTRTKYDLLGRKLIYETKPPKHGQGH